MRNPDEKIHVIPLGEQWEVEAESGVPLAHEDGKATAVAVALELARDEGVNTVIVHDGHGVTEAVSAYSLPPESTETRATEKPQDA